MSEVREMKFNKVGQERDHEDLHISGQIFSKSVENGATVINPCAGCIVKLSTPSDTSVHVNLTTENDGYFSFHGKNFPYSITLNNEGHNKFEISTTNFKAGGITTIKIINAKGNSTETYNLKKM
jgi:hypothetical protein